MTPARQIAALVAAGALAVLIGVGATTVWTAHVAAMMEERT